ncbi:MAG: YraN family protein [Pseudomonadota bacterium]
MLSAAITTAGHGEKTMRVVTPTTAKAARGRQNHLAGLLAEEGVERLYRRDGASILARRRRIGGGELDLVAKDGDILVFVEVKKRGRRVVDDPIRPQQWRRLEQAASQFMIEHTNETGRACRARFDVVLVDGTAQPTVIKNARGFEQDDQ